MSLGLLSKHLSILSLQAVAKHCEKASVIHSSPILGHAHQFSFFFSCLLVQVTIVLSMVSYPIPLHIAVVIVFCAKVTTLRNGLGNPSSPKCVYLCPCWDKMPSDASAEGCLDEEEHTGHLDVHVDTAQTHCIQQRRGERGCCLQHHLPPFEGTKTCRQIQCWISLKAWPVFKGLHILVQLQWSVLWSDNWQTC